VDLPGLGRSDGDGNFLSQKKKGRRPTRAEEVQPGFPEGDCPDEEEAELCDNWGSRKRVLTGDARPGERAYGPSNRKEEI